MKTNQSKSSHEAAQRVIPGGVNSPVRAFKGVGGSPIFIDRGEGPYLHDVDGNRYIDYVQSWGPLILGHAYPSVVDALKKATERGTSYGAPTNIETELAALVCDMVPSAEMVRFVNSGTEATMSVLRVARAYTGRNKIIKFTGCYHGHGDMLLVKAGSGVATLGLPDSPGVPPGAVQDTLTAPFNDLDAVKALFEANPDEIAAIIIEPVAANMGVVLPEAGYLAGLRALTEAEGALLIFDEVMTGFRVALGGAQEHYSIMPDLTALGKVIGGGLPVGAYAGREEIMKVVAPVGPMYQAGTLSGNPLAMAAGLETLKVIQQDGVFDTLLERTDKLCTGIGAAAENAGIPVYQTQVGTMFCTYFSEKPVTDWDGASQADTDRYAKFFWALAEAGVYMAPSQFEAGFMSFVHTDEVIEETIAAAQMAFRSLS
ncbi:MAG: glutamate-1-semialdehyde 2,1-aminomutase [Chloroflexota bacterium]